MGGRRVWMCGRLLVWRPVLENLWLTLIMTVRVSSSLQPGMDGDVSSFASKMLGEGCRGLPGTFCFLNKRTDASRHPILCSALNREVMPGAAAHVLCPWVSDNIVGRSRGGPERKDSSHLSLFLLEPWIEGSFMIYLSPCISTGPTTSEFLILGS